MQQRTSPRDEGHFSRLSSRQEEARLIASTDGNGYGNEANFGDAAVRVR